MDASAESIDGPRRLAQVAGAYRERLAAPLLRSHVRRIWINEVSRPTVLEVVPDGCMDIYWKGGDLHVAGPDTEVVSVTLAAPARLVGIRFVPGVAPAWLRAPAAELINSRAPLREFWGRAATERLADRLAEASGPEAIAKALEQALLTRLPSVCRPDPTASATLHAMTGSDEEENRSGATLVRRLADDLGVSERTLRRRCRDAFGYGPKTLERILRFQKFLRLLRRSKLPHLSDLAVAAGYADQAHLSREVRRLSGMTPRGVLTELGL